MSECRAPPESCINPFVCVSPSSLGFLRSLFCSGLLGSPPLVCTCTLYVFSSIYMHVHGRKVYDSMHQFGFACLFLVNSLVSPLPMFKNTYLGTQPLPLGIGQTSARQYSFRRHSTHRRTIELRRRYQTLRLSYTLRHNTSNHDESRNT